MTPPICYAGLPPKEILQPLYDLAKNIGVEVVIHALLCREMGERFYCNGRPCEVQVGGKIFLTTLRLSGDYGTYTRFMTDVPELDLTITWTHNICHPSLGLFCEYLRFPDRLVGRAYYHTKEQTVAEQAERSLYTLHFPDSPWTK